MLLIIFFMKSFLTWWPFLSRKYHKKPRQSNYKRSNTLFIFSIIQYKHKCYLFSENSQFYWMEKKNISRVPLLIQYLSEIALTRQGQPQKILYAASWWLIYMALFKFFIFVDPLTVTYLCSFFSFSLFIYRLYPIYCWVSFVCHSH